MTRVGCKGLRRHRIQALHEAFTIKSEIVGAPSYRRDRTRRGRW